MQQQRRACAPRGGVSTIALLIAAAGGWACFGDGTLLHFFSYIQLRGGISFNESCRLRSVLAARAVTRGQLHALAFFCMAQLSHLAVAVVVSKPQADVTVAAAMREAAVTCGSNTA